MKKRMLLTTCFKRLKASRKSQPIQASRATHLRAEAEKLSGATYSSCPLAKSHGVSPIFYNEPR
jgi:hypothetical protein